MLLFHLFKLDGWCAAASSLLAQMVQQLHKEVVACVWLATLVCITFHSLWLFQPDTAPLLFLLSGKLFHFYLSWLDVSCNRFSGELIASEFAWLMTLTLSLSWSVTECWGLRLLYSETAVLLRFSLIGPVGHMFHFDWLWFHPRLQDGCISPTYLWRILYAQYSPVVCG